MHTHRNNIGFLRLLFASAVICGHAPELIDGDAGREPVTAILPYTSLGALAVSGFFLLSGYLITQSMLKERNIPSYLQRRFLRILPGFLIAYVLSVVVLAPLLGVDVRHYAREALENMIFLKAPPEMRELGVPFPSVNGAMWTIAYEFRCYIAIAALWALGVLAHRRWILALTICGLLLTLSSSFWPMSYVLDRPAHIRWFDLPFGSPISGVPFYTTFMVGACFFLYRDEVFERLDWRPVLLSILAASIAFQFASLAEFARSLLLAAPVFWLAMKADLGRLQRINDRWDISYGTYLYGWPISTTILFFHRSIDPWVLATLSLLLAWPVGWASWVLIEKRAKSLRWPVRRRAEAA